MTNLEKINNLPLEDFASLLLQTENDNYDILHFLSPCDDYYEWMDEDDAIEATVKWLLKESE